MKRARYRVVAGAVANRGRDWPKWCFISATAHIAPWDPLPDIHGQMPSAGGRIDLAFLFKAHEPFGNQFIGKLVVELAFAAQLCNGYIHAFMTLLALMDVYL